MIFIQHSNYFKIDLTELLAFGSVLSFVFVDALYLIHLFKWIALPVLY